MMQGWDCRISEVVDIVKGTFCFNPKDAKGDSSRAAAN